MIAWARRSQLALSRHSDTISGTGFHTPVPRRAKPPPRRCYVDPRTQKSTCRSCRFHRCKPGWVQPSRIVRLRPLLSYGWRSTWRSGPGDVRQGGQSHRRSGGHAGVGSAWPDEYRSDRGPGTGIGPPQERDGPWEPNPAARPHPTAAAISTPPRWSTPACVAQDRVPLGQGRQAAVPEDTWWPSALPGRRDPSTGRRAGGTADRLSGQSLRHAIQPVDLGWHVDPNSIASADCGRANGPRSVVIVSWSQDTGWVEALRPAAPTAARSQDGPAGSALLGYAVVEQRLGTFAQVAALPPLLTRHFRPQGGCGGPVRVCPIWRRVGHTGRPVTGRHE